MNWEQPAYLDSHAHVQARQFDADRDEVIARAAAAGVGTIVCSSDDEASSRAAIALACAHSGVWATVGVHPHEAAGADGGTFERIATLARAERVVAIGEIGLDFYRDLSPRPVQRRVFERQLGLARSVGLPVVIHSRDAAKDTYTILRAWGEAGHDVGAAAPGVMHCFGYDVTWAERFLALGFLLSIPGTVTYPKAEQMQEVAAMVPEASMLVETDCPYLSPQPWRGRRNEPSYLPETVAKIAALRQVDAAHLGETTAENARRLFGLERTTTGPETSESMKGTR